MNWHWKPFHTRMAYYIEDIVLYFTHKLPSGDRIRDFVGGWTSTIALYMDKNAMESLRQAMEDAKHGRSLTYEEVFGDMND